MMESKWIESLLSIDAVRLCQFTLSSGDISRIQTPKPIGSDFWAQRTRSSTMTEEYYYQVEHSNIMIGCSVHIYFLEANTPCIEDFYSDSRSKFLKDALLRIYAGILLSSCNYEHVYLRLINESDNSVQQLDIPPCEHITNLQIHCERYSHWALKEISHLKNRDEYLSKLVFPHQTYRIHQDRLVKHVSEAFENRHHLLIEAATGIGKTSAVVYPALKAMESEQIDRLFLLTTRTTGRKLFLDATREIIKCSPNPGSVRVLELSSRDKLCKSSGYNCNLATCHGCTDFFAKLPDARMEATEVGWLDSSSLKEVANKHLICPYFLAIEMAKWSDVIIADVNHYFDHKGLLYEFKCNFHWRIAVVIDEAHNLIDRIRSMYSANINENELHSAYKTASNATRKKLKPLINAWKTLVDDLSTQDQAICPSPYISDNSHFITTLPPYFIESAHQFLQTVSAVKSGTIKSKALLKSIIFKYQRFLRLYSTVGPHSYIILKKQGNTLANDPIGGLSEMALNNVICADHIDNRFMIAETSVLFSATLQPFDLYSDLLGIPLHQTRTSIPSPYSKNQIDLRFGKISTRFHNREQTLEQIAKRIAAQYHRKQGNYLVFASSYNYVNELSECFKTLFPHIPKVVQSANMSEKQASNFINLFHKNRGLIGFAILGGGFAEGISLEGDALIGVFIVNIGFPVSSPENNKVSDIIEEHFGFGSGYIYTYLYPTIRRITQAAGRLLRGPNDTGVIDLIDDRLSNKQYKELLPYWWFK